MRLYTIGFTRKPAERFFTLLRENGVERVIDTRLHPGGQLAGFAKQDDLPFFLRIGLARGWERFPDRCYVQITGVYTFPDYLGGRCFADLALSPKELAAALYG